MRIITTLIAAATMGLALAPAAFADTALETLVLARDDCGGTDNLRLDWFPGASTAGCGKTFGFLSPVIGPLADDWPLADGIGTFTLDATRTIDVAISVDSYNGGGVGGIGDETVAIELTAVTTKNKSVSLGSATKTVAAADHLRKGTVVYEFSLPLTAAQGANTYKDLNLNMSADGDVLGGFVNTNGTSYVALPIPGDVDAGPPEDA